MTTVDSALAAVRAHPEVERLAAALRLRPGAPAHPEGPVRFAAVLLALRMGDQGEPELLTIKRAEAEGDPWSGHIDDQWTIPLGAMAEMDADAGSLVVEMT